MKVRLEHTFLFVIAIEAARMYMTIFERGHGWLLYYIANSVDERPYVYRVLLPFLSRLLHYVFGGDIVVWLGILFVLSAIGAYLAMRYLYEAFYENGDLPAFLGFQILLLLCLIETKVYDYATAAFFALSLGLLARGKLRIFLILFPVATLNRETTFLLTLFFAVYFFGKIPKKLYALSLVYQVVVYVSIKEMVQLLFSRNGGQPVYWTFWNVVSVYAHLWQALLILIPIGYLLIRSWKRVPNFIQVVILVMVPAQIILHLLFGKAFEVRVFAESIVFCVFIMVAFNHPIRCIANSGE